MFRIRTEKTVKCYHLLPFMIIKWSQIMTNILMSKNIHMLSYLWSVNQHVGIILKNTCLWDKWKDLGPNTLSNRTTHKSNSNTVNIATLFMRTTWNAVFFHSCQISVSQKKNQIAALHPRKSELADKKTSLLITSFLQ